MSNLSFKKIILSVFLFNSLVLCFPVDKYSLDRDQFVARGQNEAICTINEYGYFSVFTKSKNGTAFQIVDRMKGPDSVYGRQSESDGRQDLLFDEGLYKIRMYSGEKDAGNVSLNVIPFKEQNPSAPVLKNAQYVETTLGDFEQRSYWIEVKTDSPVLFEASGRALSKMHIWKDGSWLVDTDVYSSLDESVEGRPLTVLTICEKLNPGYYKVTMYGKEPLKWANENNQFPLYIKNGARTIPTNSRFSDTIDSMGRNRYIVEEGANYFLLQTGEKESYRLSVRNFGKGNPDSYDYDAMISNKSRTPECKINASLGSGFILMTVSGSAGKKITLQTMKKESYYSFYVDPGKYWVSTIHSGFIGDNIEPQGFIVEQPYSGKTTVKYADMDTISGKKGWQGEFNLTSEVSLYLDVEDGGNYVFESTGVDAEIKAEKFFLGYPRNYVPPKYERMKFSTYLEKGINVFKIRPLKQGILNLTIKKDSLFGIFNKKPGEQSERGSVQFPSIDLEYRATYRLYVNEQGYDTDYGLILRKLPLDLDESLPVVLRPGEDVTVVFYNDSERTLNIDSYRNIKYTVKIDGNKTLADTTVRRGRHELILKNEGKSTEIYSLRTTVPETPESKKPVYLSTEVLKSFPKFDTIKTGEQIFFDLDRCEKKTFLLNVDKAGIYSLESTGRLKTKATVRTRIITDLFNASSNGVGRNFLLHTYLKEGIYQVTVETLDISKGHLGVIAKYSQPVDGGTLLDGKTFRDAPDPGIAVLYKFDIETEGEHTINTIGLNNKKFICRLEDKDGWPLIKPNSDTSLSLHLNAGSYRLMSMPSDVWGRRLTTLTRVIEKKTYKPKEPVDLQINDMFRSQWIESEKDGTRQTDPYYFTLPSSMKIRINFTENMATELYKVTGTSNKKIKDIYPDSPFEGELEDGRYLMKLRSQKIDNFTDYTVGVFSDELVEGLSYEMRVPDSITVSVKENSLVEISSKGTSDVKGTLYDANGEIISYSDDEYNDWNFSLFEYLAGGKYLLKIEGAGSGNAKSTVSMRVIPEKETGDITVPFSKTVDMKGRKNNFKLTGSGLFSFDISANSVAGISIYEKTSSGQKEILKKTGKNAGFDIFLPRKKNYYLALWSMDHIDENITVKISETDCRKLSLSGITKAQEFAVPGGKTSFCMDVDASTYVFECNDLVTGNRIGDIYYGFRKSPDSPVVFEKTDGRISTGNGMLFITIENKYGDKIKLEAEKKFLGEKKDFVSLNKSEPYFFDIKPGRSKINLLIAQSDSILPLCGFVTGSKPDSLNPGERVYVSSGISISANMSVDISYGGKSGKAVVWNPESTGNTEAAAVIFKEFDIPETTGSDGFSDGRIENEAVILSLPGGYKRCGISLDEGMATFALKGENVVAIFHTTIKPGEFSFDTDADKVGIIKYSETSSGYYRITSVPSSKQSGNDPGILYEKYSLTGGRSTLPVPTGKAGEDRFLYTAGNLKYNFINYEGRSIKSDASGVINVGGNSGLLIIENGPGFAKAWLSGIKNPEGDRWGNYSPKSAVNTERGRSVDLSEKPSWLNIRITKDSVIDLNTDNYAVYTLIKNGKNVMTGEIPAGSGHSIIISQGNYTLGMRLIRYGNIPTASPATIYINEVSTIKENDTNEFLLDINGSYGFSFSIDEKQDIGIGYKSGYDNIDCYLYDKDMNLIKNSPVIFTTLEKGGYYIIYKLTDMNVTKFIPIIVSSKTIEQKIYNENVRSFLIENGFIKSE